MATADHDRQRQAAHRRYKLRTVVESLQVANLERIQLVTSVSELSLVQPFV